MKENYKKAGTGVRGFIHYLHLRWIDNKGGDALDEQMKDCFEKVFGGERVNVCLGIMEIEP